MSPVVNEDFYFKLLESNVAKNLSIALAVVFVVLVIPGVIGIIMFEKFGSDKKRTIVNKFISSMCYTLCLGNFFSKKVSFNVFALPRALFVF